jgi:hypothetical protein
MKGFALRGLLFSVSFLTAVALQAQFVPLSRCRAAYPCAFPFGLQYRPDPLIAGQYGGPGNTGLAARVAVKWPPKVEIVTHTPPDTQAIDEAARRFLATHPRVKRAAIQPPEENAPARAFGAGGRFATDAESF